MNRKLVLFTMNRNEHANIYEVIPWKTGVAVNIIGWLQIRKSIKYFGETIFNDFFQNVKFLRIVFLDFYIYFTFRS